MSCQDWPSGVAPGEAQEGGFSGVDADAIAARDAMGDSDYIKDLCERALDAYDAARVRRIVLRGPSPYPPRPIRRERTEGAA